MRTHFDQIIAAYVSADSSKIALKNAFDLSKKFNAKLTIINVNPSRFPEGQVKRDIENIVGDSNAQYGFVQKEGKPYKEILALESALNADLIVMGTHGSKERDPNWLGGNAFKVLSGSRCPVLIFPKDYGNQTLDTIVLPLSDSTESRQKVPLTAAIAKIYGAKIHIAAICKNEDPEIMYKLKIYAKQAKEYIENEEVECTVSEVTNKNVAQGCADFAKKVDADLIAIMSERENPIGMFLGHYAQELLNSTTLPVLTIHVKDTMLTGDAGY
jgi:nucleotide-binding universal stress UspA family protein